MNKLLFIIPEFSHGGTNKSLENLLSIINHKYDIYILCLQKDGIYKNVFKKYNLLNLSKIYNICIASSVIKKIFFLIKTIFKIDLWTYIYNYEANLISNKYSFLKIIAFQEGLSTYFTSFFKSSKIAWVHCDYNLYLYNSQITQSEFNIYDKYDNIICVSKYTTKIFKDFYPQLGNKTKCIYNVINPYKIFDQITSCDELDERFDDSFFTILSIGRFVKVKQFHLIPEIIKQIKNSSKNLCFKWYIIGDGNNSLMEQTKRYIKEYGLEDNLILLGAKSNPYPYMKKSNIVVCTSYSEAYPCVLNEAKVLHIPILTTNFPTAKEIVDETCGIIEQIEDFPTTLINLLTDSNYYNSIKKSTENFNIDNENLIKELDCLFNS